MTIINIFCITVLFFSPVIANTVSHNRDSVRTNDMPRLTIFNSLLKELDLNKEIQNGFSISQREYKELENMWASLNKKEKIQILCGSSMYSFKNTLAQFLLYALNDGAEWKMFTKKLRCVDAKNKSLTMSCVKSLISLKTAHNTLLDLLQDGQCMFIDGKLVINARIKSEAYNRQDKNAYYRLTKWEDLINSSQNFSNQKKLAIVNNFFNDVIEAKSDHEKSQKRDYWQSPIETLVRGKGDCEDYALAKYVSLRLLGIPKNQLLIGIIRLAKFGELHAVLFYYPIDDHDPWVLDNLSLENFKFNEPQIIRLSTKITLFNVKPLIGFNENIYVEFKRGLKTQCLDKDPLSTIPMFTVAINNSMSLISNLSS